MLLPVNPQGPQGAFLRLNLDRIAQHTPAAAAHVNAESNKATLCVLARVALEIDIFEPKAKQGFGYGAVVPAALSGFDRVQRSRVIPEYSKSIVMGLWCYPFAISRVAPINWHSPAKS